MNKGNSPERKAKMSEENIYQRLSKASGMCEKLAKANECNTGKQRYMYVSHDQYVAMIRPILIECGIVTTWDTELKDGAILVTGTFTSLDAPNDRIVSTIPIVPSRRDPAAFGAALSYAKKYDYIIVNDDLSVALKNLESIIIAKGLENDIHTARKNTR